MIGRDGRCVFAVGALFFALWSVANAPALGQAWWFFDDYSESDVFSAGNVQHHLEQGRPGQLVWMTTFLVDGGGRSAAGNVLLRLLQGALHSLAAAIATVLLWRETRRPLALAAGLPFLLWPYAGEAVLWRAAGTYPAAALLSLGGAWLIRTRQRSRPAGVVGLALVAAAVLTQQLAAGAALVVWCLALGTLALGTDPLPWRRLGGEALLLANGYVAGGLASVTVAWLLSGGNPSRLQPVVAIGDKVHFLADANRTFFTSPLFYPRGLAMLLVVAAAAPFAALLAAVVRRWVPAGRAGVAAGALASAFATPYAAQLAVADSQLSWRVLYLAPLALAGGCVVLDRIATTRAVRGLVAAMLLAIAAAFVPLSWSASGAYVRVYQADRAALRGIEAEAATKGVRRVLVVTSPYVTPHNLNPHGLTFPWGGLKLSALLAEWSAPYFIRWFSTSLEPVDDDAVRDACVAQCVAAPEAPGFRLRRVEPGPTLCVCPP